MRLVNDDLDDATDARWCAYVDEQAEKERG